jgi:hypothetical protein
MGCQSGAVPLGDAAVVPLGEAGVAGVVVDVEDASDGVEGVAGAVVELDECLHAVDNVLAGAVEGAGGGEVGAVEGGDVGDWEEADLVEDAADVEFFTGAVVVYGEGVDAAEEPEDEVCEADGFPLSVVVEPPELVAVDVVAEEDAVADAVEACAGAVVEECEGRAVEVAVDGAEGGDGF